MERIILYIFSYLTEGFIVFHYFSCLFTPRFRAVIRISTLTFLYLILFFLAFFEISWLNAIAFILVNGIFLFTQYRFKFFHGILHLSMITAIMATTEIVVYSIVSKFAPHFYTNSQNSLALILFTIFSKILFLLIVFLLILATSKHKFQQNPTDHSTPLLVLIPIASIFIVLTFITIGEASFSIFSVNTLVTISAFSLLIINLLVFGINQYNQKKNQEFTDMQLLLQKESDLLQYYEMLLNHNENQGILIHDFRKHLQSISLLNKEKANDKIDAYIHYLLQSSDLSDTAKICDNKMLNAILCRYKRRCMEEHLTFHADIRSQSIDFLENFSLTSLFCNLLDNSIEASIGIPDGFIELRVQKKENTPFVIITVINSCRKNPISLDGKLLTSKRNAGKNHGFGMKSIKKTVKLYGGDMEVYYDSSTYTFHSLITLRDNKHPYRENSNFSKYW